jgi:hypothetical protein
MKVHIITDDKGDIIGTVHGVPGSHGDAPSGRPVPLPGQQVHELELPKELEGSRDADQLHQRLKGLLPKR